VYPYDEPYDDDQQRRHDEARISLYHAMPIGDTGTVYMTRDGWKNHPAVGDVVKVFCMDGTRISQTAQIIELKPFSFEYRFRIIEDIQQLS